MVVIADSGQCKSITCFFFFSFLSMTVLLPIQDVSGAAQQILVLHKIHTLGLVMHSLGYKSSQWKPRDAKHPVKI